LLESVLEIFNVVDLHPNPELFALAVLDLNINGMTVNVLADTVKIYILFPYNDFVNNFFLLKKLKPIIYFRITGDLRT
jgi:hypothetical protein